MTYTLTVFNCQGASDYTTNLPDVDAVLRQINTWSDPENMVADIRTEWGVQIYLGPASSSRKIRSAFVAFRRDIALLCRDGLWRTSRVNGCIDTTSRGFRSKAAAMRFHNGH